MAAEKFFITPYWVISTKNLLEVAVRGLDDVSAWYSPVRCLSGLVFVVHEL